MYKQRIARGVANSNRLRERPKAINRPFLDGGNEVLARECRTALGWYSDNADDFVTVAEAASRTGLSHPTITRLIDGDPSVKGETVRQFAVRLNRDPFPFLASVGLSSKTYDVGILTRLQCAYDIAAPEVRAAFDALVTAVLGKDGGE